MRFLDTVWNFEKMFLKTNSKLKSNILFKLGGGGGVRVSKVIKIVLIGLQ